jgi:creatinase/prolidase-like protein
MNRPFPRPRLVDYRDNGKKLQAAFSAAEMQRRRDAIRGYLAENLIDAALFTSYHNICYLSGFLYCSFGRRYGFLVDNERPPPFRRPSMAASLGDGAPMIILPIPIGSVTIFFMPFAP